MTATSRLVEDVTCLGCGCACDDIGVRIDAGRIIEATRACALGAAWFGDGIVSSRVRVSGRDATLDEALAAAAAILSPAVSPLVYLAGDLTCEAQREGVAIADLLRATIDTVTSATALPSVLAGQERGRAGATLGEIANRADVLVYWAVDPDARYPRFRSRYGEAHAGVHLPDGRRGRRVVSVDVGAARGPVDADERYAIAPDEEVAALVFLQSAAGAVRGGADDAAAGAAPPESCEATARALASTLRAARYGAIVCDAEPDSLEPRRDSGRAEALLAVTQSLNDHTRCALLPLRGGGNRSGADAVLTWQTGFPAAIDFARGFPRYRPFDGTAEARLIRGEVDVVLVLGAIAGAPEHVVSRMTGVPALVIGPRASESALASAAVAIDSGVAGIHEPGLALRMDDVPLPLRATVDGPPSTKAIAGALRERIVAVRHGDAGSSRAAAPGVQPFQRRADG
jgi:formylmethanofuran dehydrogenase subunit B